MRIAIGVLILLSQIGAIAYSRFTPHRYFCWAPFDQQTEFWIVASQGGAPLDNRAVLTRYRRPAHGFDNRSAHHLFDIIERAERRYEPTRQAKVDITYRVNGGEKSQWSYPHD